MNSIGQGEGWVVMWNGLGEERAIAAGWVESTDGMVGSAHPTPAVREKNSLQEAGLTMAMVRFQDVQIGSNPRLVEYGEGNRTLTLNQLTWQISKVRQISRY